MSGLLLPERLQALNFGSNNSESSLLTFLVCIPAAISINSTVPIIDKLLNRCRCDPLQLPIPVPKVIAYDCFNISGR